MNQKVASLIFQQMGIEIDCATNGFEAIEMCEENDYDIVFMDIQMPEMDGIEATRRLFNENLISSPSEVLAMTANVLDEDRKKCFEVGMSGFLSKPIDTRELKEALLYYLENKKEYVS